MTLSTIEIMQLLATRDENFGAKKIVVLVVDDNGLVNLSSTSAAIEVLPALFLSALEAIGFQVVQTHAVQSKISSDN